MLMMAIQGRCGQASLYPAVNSAMHTAKTRCDRQAVHGRLLVGGSSWQIPCRCRSAF